MPGRVHRLDRRDLPHPAGLGRQLRPPAGRADGRADRHEHAGRRRAPGPRARPRRHGRPSLGADRGDHRRGPLPGRDRRHRVCARARIHRAHLHAQALRRVLGIPRRPQPGPGRGHQQAGRGPAAAPVRDGHPARRGALGDALLHRHRRHPDRRRSLPAVRGPTGSLGLHRDGGGRLLRHQLPGVAAPRGLRAGRRGGAGAGRRGGRRAAHRAVLRPAAHRRGRTRGGRRGAGRPGRAPGAAAEVRAGHARPGLGPGSGRRGRRRPGPDVGPADRGPAGRRVGRLASQRRHPATVRAAAVRRAQDRGRRPAGRRPVRHAGVLLVPEPRGREIPRSRDRRGDPDLPGGAA